MDLIVVRRSLGKDRSYPSVGGIYLQDELVHRVRMAKDGRRGKERLESCEGGLGLWGPMKGTGSREAQQRLLLVTVFALSVRYQPADVSLAISSGLLNVLSQLCGTETMLGQPLQLLQKPGVSQLSTALKVASTRLLQILAISTGTYADKLSPKVVQSLLDLLCSQLKNLLSQAGVSHLSAGKDQEDTKHDDTTDSEKKRLQSFDP
ncbi:probable E3 ubiquitin-protein ligase HERC1 [Nematolebias whitei]|uniref:probable E3 ubiquitin-protein ligase HERC1 n=1 Tax=Nematolebias whitei TaxID=451745 RepID=UPI0018995F06|nr:probable E3 ubiquitin-protein ligase HERC1 [Nematolebias whitei]